MISAFFRKHFAIIATVWLCVSLSCGFHTAAYADAMAHELEHSQQFKHHHHDNLGTHSDAQDDTAYHAHADGGTNPAALLVSSPLHCLSVDSSLKAVPLYIHWISPPLVGLYRPPRLAA